MTIEELIQEVNRRNITVSESFPVSAERYAALLKEWNNRINLTAIDEPEEVYEKHFLDCLIPLQFEPVTGQVADVGSGAGFPGLVWAIALPDAAFTLIEPTGKRCRFLEEVKRQLLLDNVTIVNERAEEYAAKQRESFDVVTARAVASLPLLSELCLPLVRPGGRFIAMKGPMGLQEAREAAYALRILGSKPAKVISASLSDGQGRTIVVCEKEKKTPPQYPRNYGRMKHSPLLEKTTHA